MRWPTLRRVIRHRPGTRARQELLSLQLGPGEIALDCGANVGEITAILARRGATVYAFEPNPDAFHVLRERFADRPNVHCLPLGVLDRDGVLPLYLHRNAADDPVRWSTGSSLLEGKENVRPDRFVEVEVIDLCAFLDRLDGPVRVLKLDVEGVECRILRRLIETGWIDRIEHIYVETHDRKVPALREETEALRALLAERGLRHVRLDWE